MIDISNERYDEYAGLLVREVEGLVSDLRAESIPLQRLAAGKICEHMSNYLEARELYAAAASFPDAPVEALVRHALVQVKLGNAAQVLADVVLLADRHGDVAVTTLIGTPLSVRTVLGDVLLAAGQRDAALAAYTEALATLPDDRRAGSQTVQLLVEAGDLERAREVESTVNLEPGREGLRALLAASEAGRAGDPAIGGVRFGNIRSEIAV